MKAPLLHQLQMREAVSRLRHLDVGSKAIEHFIAMPDTLIPAFFYGTTRTVSEEDAEFLAEISLERRILPYLGLENDEARLVLFISRTPATWKHERPIFYRNTASAEAMVYSVGKRRYMEAYSMIKISRSASGGIEWQMQ